MKGARHGTKSSVDGERFTEQDGGTSLRIDDAIDQLLEEVRDRGEILPYASPMSVFE
jgi:hypothetical protein